MSSPQSFLQPTQITRREWAVACCIAIVAVSWSLMPTLTGLQQVNGDTYLYSNLPDTSDTQVYYAFIDQNAQGYVFYKNLFTGEDQRGVLFNPLWLVLGGIEHFSGYSPATVFTAAKAFFGFWLVLALYYVIAHFLRHQRWRTLALLIAVFGGGLGGILLLIHHADPRLVWIQTQTPILRSLSADLTYAAGFTWLTLAHSPIFIISQLLLIGSWMRTWRGLPIGWTMVMVGLLALIHPYDPALFFGMFAVHIVLGILTNSMTAPVVRSYVRRIAVLLLAMIPAVGYYLFAIFKDPVIRQWFQQNYLLSPPLTSLIAGYGLLSILAFIGARKSMKNGADGKLLVTWLVGGLTLSYLPLIPFQAKMISLLNVPVAILSVVSIKAIVARFAVSTKKVFYIAAGIIGIFLTFSTVIIFPFRISASQRAERTYHYANTDLIRTLTWIRQNTPPSSIILGDFFTGNLVPQFASRSTYLGHNIQTINYQQKLALIRGWFFGTDQNVADKEEFLRNNHISYVVWGPNEKKRGNFLPEQLSTLQLVYQSGDVALYRVNN